MKAKLLVVSCALFGLLNSSLVLAQSSPADKEVFAMLKGFYTNYIRTFNQYPTDEKKLDPLLKANCDPLLLARLKKKTESGDLDYDPFFEGAGCRCTIHQGWGYVERAGRMFSGLLSELFEKRWQDAAGSVQGNG